MSAEIESMAYRTAPAISGRNAVLLIGGSAVLLGLAAAATQLKSAAALAGLAASYPALHIGMWLVCCAFALTGWNIVASRRLLRVRSAPLQRKAPHGMADDPLADAALVQRFSRALAAAAAGPGTAAVLVVNMGRLRGARPASSHGGDGGNDGEDCNDSSASLRHRFGRHQFGRRLIEHAPAAAIVVRLAADEFAVLLQAADSAAAQLTAAGLHAALSRPFPHDGDAIDVAASIGVALAPDHGCTAESLLRAARMAAALAKADGGRDWRLFDAGLCQAAYARNALRADLRPALQSGQFVPYYQPIVSLDTGDIVGMEVLARWAHPLRGVLAPNSFIHMIEEQRLCGQLSLSLLHQVMQDARAWPRSWTFAFNASAGQLPGLVTLIDTADQETDSAIEASRIEIEVTETLLIEDMGVARQVVRAVHATGAKVVLDDFGTGYANLLLLRELPFDRIKIDRSFVRDMLLSPRADACMRAMLGLARTLGASVIAEGVESEATEARLRELGCEFAQGYYYSPPVPAKGVGVFADRRAVAA